MSSEKQYGASAGAQPSEEELRAAYEAELNSLSTTDMLAQAAVTLLNLGARRLAPPTPDEPVGGGSPGAASTAAGGRDLEQVRDAIDAVRALLEILQRRIPQELRPLRDALSQLQMAYAREVQLAGPAAAREQTAGAPAAGAGESSPPAAPSAPGAAIGSDDKDANRPGPAEASGRLWVPGR